MREFTNNLIARITGFIIRNKEVATTESITLKELKFNIDLLHPQLFKNANSAANSNRYINSSYVNIETFIIAIALLNDKLNKGVDLHVSQFRFDNQPVLLNHFLLNQDGFYVDEVLVMIHFKSQASLLVKNLQKYFEKDISDSGRRIYSVFLKQLNNTIIELVAISI